MMSATDGFLKKNVAYAACFSGRDLAARPAQEIAIVACMDARLSPGALLGLDEGDAHVIRNAGGVVTDDVIRSLTISQRLLGTREIMLIRHTDCGMQTFTDAELEAAIVEESGIRPHFSMEAFADLEEDLRRSMARLQASPFLVHRHAIRGFVYDVKTGLLREVE
jgi:carbonic anhydrase